MRFRRRKPINLDPDRLLTGRETEVQERMDSDELLRRMNVTFLPNVPTRVMRSEELRMQEFYVRDALRQLRAVGADSADDDWIYARPVSALLETIADRLEDAFFYSERPPVLVAYPTDDGSQWKVYCGYCLDWHYHGRPLGSTGGHRAAHCDDDGSPYKTHGYNLLPVLGDGDG